MSALVSALGPHSGTIGAVFDLMEVAEEEISAAKVRHPKAAESLDSAFSALSPEGFTGFGRELYRAHARELLDRVAAGGDVRLGTTAEVLAALSKVAGAAPLTQLGQAVFERAFARAFPDDADGFLPDGPMSEPWEGACAEEESRIRKRLARDRGVS